MREKDKNLTDIVLVCSRCTSWVPTESVDTGACQESETWTLYQNESDVGAWRDGRGSDSNHEGM